MNIFNYTQTYSMFLVLYIAAYFLDFVKRALYSVELLPITSISYLATFQYHEQNIRYINNSIKVLLNYDKAPT